jgi:glycosyltransferase involved in cell wall biosynthesis
MPEPQISVALVTRNRPDSLARTLWSLREQDREPFEVIVSDDSDDEHAAAVRGVVEEFGAIYRRGPRSGLYANRNAAALACSGTHVRTMDDDHEFPAGHWQRCIEATAADPEAIWVIGETIPSLGVTSECPGELQPRGFALPPRDPDHTWAIADGASIYPAGIFRAGIVFSEAFRFGSSYLEFGSRLHALGYRIRCLRGTLVIHHADFDNRSFMDSREDLGAKAFATISHSFGYQPTLRNRVVTSAELLKEIARHGPRGAAAVARGYRAYREQRVRNGSA